MEQQSFAARRGKDRDKQGNSRLAPNHASG
jgi:hypothetical protein